MVGKGVTGYGLVFTLVLIFLIFTIVTPAYAIIENLKFDQSEIPKGHSDVITITELNIPIIISSEDFENGFTTWVNTGGDDSDCWLRNDGTGQTTNTGPRNGAGTPATTWYVYYESSPGSPACNGAELDKAYLLGPAIDFNSFNDVQIIFSRHMFDGGGWHGDDMGKLSLMIEKEGIPGEFEEIWSQEGNQGNSWLPTVTVDLPFDNSGQRRLMFNATDLVTGSQSDMAVDEIIIQGEPAAPSPVISFEDFENGFTTWVNTGGDDSDCWLRNDGTGQTTNTGPRNGAGTPATTWYVYYESSPGSPACNGAELDKAYLLGPAIDFHNYRDISITFSRHMFDGGGWHGDDMGRLSLMIETGTNSGEFDERPLWSQEGNQGNSWLPTVTVDLPFDNSGQRRLMFNATDLVTGSQSDMAIDEITIRGVPVGGVATNHVVTLEGFDPGGAPLSWSPQDVTLQKRDPYIFWQMVEFGDTDDITNLQFQVQDGSTVRITDAEGHTDTVEIISNANMTINGDTKKFHPDAAICANLGPGTNDIDLDGICDHWEDASPSMIIDYPSGEVYEVDDVVCNSFLHDPTLPVVPQCRGSDKRDIYLEIDYMAGHRPNLEALYKVIEAFANAPASAAGAPAGIRLHIQLDDTHEVPIPHRDEVHWPSDITGKQGFDQIKAVYFGTEDEQGQPDWGWKQKKQIFHYALFAHHIDNFYWISGDGETWGNDFMISLGDFTGKIGNPDEQAGTFMHELGHNLNLRHGGNDSVNCKPNHLSVMSYSRQFPDFIPTRALDYSRQTLGTPGVSTDSLMEDDHPEDDGLDMYSFNPDERITFGPIPPLIPPTTEGNINWNLVAPENEPGQDALNLNSFTGIGCDSSTNTDELMGSNDWDLVNLLVREGHSSNFEDGRSSGAGFRAAVYEEKGRIDSPMVYSPTCPSLTQVLEKVPTGIRDAARDFTSPNTHGLVVAQEKIKDHLTNYRTCSAGAGKTDILTLKSDYKISGILSGDELIKYYKDNPGQLIARDKLQFHYTIIEYILADHNKTLDPFSVSFLEGKKGIIKAEAKILNVELIDSYDENIFEVEPIYAQDELTAGASKSMKKLRLDSMLEYIKNLNPTTDFVYDKTTVINDYNQTFNEIKDLIDQDRIAEAAMKMASITHDDKINGSAKLAELESATDIIVDQYTRAIPEFGTIATLILVAAIASIIILTTKTRNIFMPQNYQ